MFSESLLVLVEEEDDADVDDEEDEEEEELATAGVMAILSLDPSSLSLPNSTGFLITDRACSSFEVWPRF